MRAAFGTLFALWGVAALAQQPGFSNRNNALGTGYNEQNQIQYGAPSGTIDNNAPQQKADSTKNRKSANRWSPISSTIRRGRVPFSSGIRI